GGGAVRIRDRQRWSEEASELAGILRIRDPRRGAVAVAAGIRVGRGAERDRAGAGVAGRQVREGRCPVWDDRGWNADAGAAEVEAAADQRKEIGTRVVHDGAAVRARRRQAGREGEASGARAAVAAGDRAGRRGARDG